jgi:hypothetical protein
MYVISFIFIYMGQCFRPATHEITPRYYAESENYPHYD